MKQLNSLSILFLSILLFLTPNLAAAIYSSEAAEIPYQINNSDRIAIGTVSETHVADYYTNNTITIKEWLYNPLPIKTIIVRTNIGANASTEDEAEFTKNESVLLMLKDQKADEGIFQMSLGFLGKHQVSDRDAVIEALKAQGKWKEEDKKGNKEENKKEKKANDTEMVEDIEKVGNQKENITENKTVNNGKFKNTGTRSEQEEKSNTTEESNKVPSISSFFVLAIVLVAFMMYTRSIRR
jgi:hypothetical protein